MPPTDTLFTLDPGRWYAYEMLPGYGSGRYYSPILIEHVQPLKTGRNLLRVAFHNACYAQGVQNFRIDFRILHRAESYLLARLEYGSTQPDDRCAVICPLTWRWLEVHFGPTVKDLAEKRGVPRDASLERIVEAVFR